jgi:hypothetical protein
MPNVDESFTTPSAGALVPYHTPRTSSTSFGDGQNTNSCLYRSSVPVVTPLPGFTLLPNLGPQILWTPIPESLPPLPGFTTLPNLGPQILSTPIHRPCPSLPGFTTLPSFLGPQTLSTPIHDAPPLSILYNKAHGDAHPELPSKQSLEPTLPPKKIVSENGVLIKHYTKSGDHAPAHLHVTGKGVEVRIGQNGKPLKGNAELSSDQKEVVQNNLPEIRSAVRKIQKWHKHISDK